MVYMSLNLLILTLTISLFLFIPIITFSSLDNNTKNDSVEASLNDATDAKFNVKTQISDECLSSPLCKGLTANSVLVDVFVFYPKSPTNNWDKISNFPGSQNERRLIIFKDPYFKNTEEVQVEASAKLPEPFNKNVIIEYFWSNGSGDLVNNPFCSVYLKLGQRANCIIAISPAYTYGASIR